jgi:general secretion pathway protein G
MKRTAFTLIEILIVVILLGILAAIVIPQFGSASEDALLGKAKTDVSTLNSQTELYRVRSGDSTANPTETTLHNNGFLKSVPTNDSYSYGYDGTTGIWTYTAN